MFKLSAIAMTVGLMLALTAPASWSRSGATLCVGNAPGCYSTIQAAVDTARDGDTIRVARGTFDGGITIDKSLSLQGAGAADTTIRGGGPVLTVGTFLANRPPTVSIAGVTVTGGVTTSSPESDEWVGAPNVIALGGGISIPPAANLSTGATVDIRDSVVARNRVTPTATAPFGPPCPNGSCPFAWAKGAGIDSWGRLTLTNTTVSDNTAAGTASDADGAGINSWWPSTLTLANSTVTRNRASAVEPNGRFAEGGGIFTDPGVDLRIENSSVSGNTAELRSTLPYFVPGADPLDMNANGGGIHAGDDGSVSISGSIVSGNSLRVNDPNGEPVAFDAALHPGSGPLLLRDSTIENNRAVARVGSSADVGPSGSAIDINGPATVSNTLIADNSTDVSSDTGLASAVGAVYAGNTSSHAALITGSVIRDNTARASSDGGAATVKGAGVLNEGVLQLRGVLITRNTGTASGATGFAQGGGIWNASLFNPPPIKLTLQDTIVTHNTLRASSGLAVQGGGLFTAFPVTLSGSQIADNSPDQCYGC